MEKWHAHWGPLSERRLKGQWIEVRVILMDGFWRVDALWSAREIPAGCTHALHVWGLDVRWLFLQLPSGLSLPLSLSPSYLNQPVLALCSMNPDGHTLNSTKQGKRNHDANLIQLHNYEVILRTEIANTAFPLVTAVGCRPGLSFLPYRNQFPSVKKCYQLSAG